MKNKPKTKIIIVVCVIFGIILGFICGQISYKIKNPETYCIWKIKTNSNSIEPSSVVWENGNYEGIWQNGVYNENAYIEKVLMDGNIWSLETICYVKGKLNSDGSRIQVEQ